MPLLRYRTKDLTALHYDKCPCGRTLVRMDRILGRSDDMLIIRGVNVFPTQIESVILEMPEFEPACRSKEQYGYYGTASGSPSGILL